MTTYKAIKSIIWEKKAGRNGPLRVSFYGSPPNNIDDYVKKEIPSIEINDNGRITYCNYFFGKTVKSFEEAESVARILNLN